MVLIFDTVESVLKKIVRGSGEKHQKDGSINLLQVIVSTVEQMHHPGVRYTCRRRRQAGLVVLMLCPKLNR